MNILQPFNIPVMINKHCITPFLFQPSLSISHFSAYTFFRAGYVGSVSRTKALLILIGAFGFYGNLSY